MFQFPSCKVFGICLVLLCLQIVPAKVNACLSWEFKCDDGQCINDNLKCNSIKDCADGSDETFEKCYDSECVGERCSYGGCIDKSKWCNGVKDCWDGTDENEFDCNSDTVYNRTLRGSCNELYAQFQCVDSLECIPHSRLCDGIEDCRDDSDESLKVCMSSLCPPGSFRCAYGACISKDAACNRLIDCRDGSDEIPSICKKMRNLSPNDIWQLKPWEIKPTERAVIPSTTPRPPSAKEGCRVAGTELRVRIMYSGIPYYNSGTVSHLTTVRLSCAPKYALVGNDVNTCDDGNWLDPLAECVKVCDHSKFISDPSVDAICSYNNEIIDCATKPLIVSSRATISCARGYYTESPIKQAERVCSEKGTWSRYNKASKKLICRPDCGRTFETVKELPWLVSVFERMPQDEYEFRCLGAIVDPFRVLTVASCFYHNINSTTSYSVLLGNQSIGFNPNREHGYDVRNIAKIEVDDVKPLALVKLINPFVFSAKERPICLQNITSTAPVTKRPTLGEPLVTFINETMKYSLTHITDTNSTIDVMALLGPIEDALKQ